MKTQIKFTNLLAEKLGKELVLDFPDRDQLTVVEFVDRLSHEPWSSEVIDDGHIRSPVILIIDNQLIQLSNPESRSVIITSASEITFQIMFAGGI